MPKKQTPRGQEAKRPRAGGQEVTAKGTAAGSPASGDLDVLKQMVELLETSSATDIKLARGDVSYEVSRGGRALAHMVPSFAPPPALAAALPAASGVPAAAPAAAVPVSNLIEIKSPMVGTFYRSPEPGAEPYCKPGARVSVGQTLCIIEAMKIMNEIESEISGTVRDVAVEDGQPVEFGQVLFRVEPNV